LTTEVALLPFLLRAFRQQSEHGRHVFAQVRSSPDLFRFVARELVERHDALLPRLLLDLLHQDAVAALEAHAGHFRRSEIFDASMTIMTSLGTMHAQHESNLFTVRLQLGVALLAREPGLGRHFEVEGDVRACAERPLTKLPQLSLTRCRLSHSHIDGFMKAWHRDDAIDAKFKLRNSRKQTLSQCNF